MIIYSKNIRELGFAVSLGVLLAAGLPLAHAEDATSHQGMHGAVRPRGARLGIRQNPVHVCFLSK